MTWAAIAWVAEGMILACLSVAVATDLARRIIPNRLVLLVLCCSIVLRAISNTGPFWVIPLVLVTVSTALSLLASYDLIGWGDAKLIAAVSVAVPVSHLVTLTMAITLAGGLLSCLYLACRFALQRIAAPAGLARSGRGKSTDCCNWRLKNGPGSWPVSRSPTPSRSSGAPPTPC